MQTATQLLGDLLTDSNAVVDSQQTRCSFERTLQTLDLRNGRLENTGLSVVPHFSVDQVESVHHQASLGVADKSVLGGVVVSPELGYEVGAVLGGVDREGLRDRQQGGSELGNSKLFSRTLMVER